MKRILMFLLIAVLCMPMVVMAQSATPSKKKSHEKLKPLSRVALSVGVEAVMGVNMQVATNLSQHFNLRGTGNVFSYTASTITSNGINFTPNLNLASAGVSIDYFPFAHHGFHLSPGVLLYNNNTVSTNFTTTADTSFTVNSNTYYSSSTSPATGIGSVGLNAQKPAFTMALGSSNIISRNGGHWSIPFEIGVAFVGQPKMNLAMTGGEVCDSTYSNCVSAPSDAALATDLQSQINTYKSDLNPLQFYPMVSVGLAYNFKIR